MSRRGAIREYSASSLWVLPSISAAVALLVGFTVSKIYVGPGSWLERFAFQGTADDARALLGNVTGTVVTVIALVLGLTIVALQLSSTQFSPRLVRNFLRDRPSQVALSVFVATFAYSASGLYTVGEAAGLRTEQFPRLAVSGSIVLLFASLGMVVYYADHLAHSIQVSAIGRRVERDTVRVLSHLGTVEVTAPTPPDWAVPLLAGRSGYVQTIHPNRLLAAATEYRVHIRLVPRVGDHLVAGTVLAWMWAHSADEPAPDPALFRAALDAAASVGFERTMEQDAAFGIRQLADMACKALSPAVNDPYTAIQSIDHLAVILCALATRRTGDEVAQDPEGRGMVVAPGRRFEDYLSLPCGLIRRYGASEPTVSVALIHLLDNCADVLPDDAEKWAVLVREADLIVADATREIAQPADLVPVSVAAARLHQAIRNHGQFRAR